MIHVSKKMLKKVSSFWEDEASLTYIHLVQICTAVMITNTVLIYVAMTIVYAKTLLLNKVSDKIKS